MKKAANAAAMSSQRHRAEGQQMRNHADRSKKELDKAEIRFLLNELSVGLTLSNHAAKMQGAAKARSRAKARAAYNAVLRFVDRIPPRGIQKGQHCRGSTEDKP
jgi:hypothetical protein